MSSISVDNAKRVLLRNEKPFFLLSDTIWMAFEKLNLEEWQNYLCLRAKQGFSSVQISVLPIPHDNSIGKDDISPFLLDEHGGYILEEPNEIYFNKAEKMLQMACECGIIPYLHLFWVNYIPDTWGAEKSPEKVIPYEKIKPLTTYMLNRFAKYDPIYSVSGDTNFETPQVTKYYQAIFDVLGELFPDAVASMHLCGGLDNVPEELSSRKNFSFYSYQSSHSKTAFLNNIFKCSNAFLQQSNKKAVINTEPCYEGLGNFENPYEKFSAFDVRRALWSSVLSGASAGVTYGAHGAWGCHKKGMIFKAKSMWGEPYDFNDAIYLDGANDAGLLRIIMEEYELMGLVPAQHLTNTPYILIGALEEKETFVVYQPFDCEFTIDKDLSEYKIIAFNLADRKPFIPHLTITNQKTLISINSSNKDSLYILRK